MAKIVSMSSGAIDPIAVIKRVFWRPATTGTALKAGDPVCYKLDAVDHKERTVDPTHLGLTIDTYAEGEQEMTGRLFSVEEPLIDNIDQFAGIVKSLGPKKGLDGDMIEIFKANSGAVVPANLVTSLTTVAGRTILAVMVGTRTLGSPTTDMPSHGVTAGSVDSKVVGIAMEARTTAGKCWVKLDENQFTHQGGNIGNEFSVAAGAVDVVVNSVNVEFLTTAESCLSRMRAKLSGLGSAHYGVYRYDVIVAADQIHHTIGHNICMEITEDQTGGLWLSASSVTLRSRSADPDLSAAELITTVIYEWYMTAGASGAGLGDPCTLRPWFVFCCDGDLPTHLLYSTSAINFGGHMTTGGIVPAAGDVAIPIRIAATNYYIVACVDDGI